jgi:hypothetical protein
VRCVVDLLRSGNGNFSGPVLLVSTAVQGSTAVEACEILFPLRGDRDLKEFTGLCKGTSDPKERDGNIESKEGLATSIDIFFVVAAPLLVPGLGATAPFL